MNKHINIFDKFLDEIRNENRYRKFTQIIRKQDRWPIVEYANHEITAWCGTDYLGMSNHPIVINAMIEAAQIYGAGSGGTRNIGGNYHYINDLEKVVALLHHKDAGLVFSSGYLSNFGAISAIGRIAKKQMIIFSDELNHASIIEGIKASGCQKVIFKHNDINHLRKVISQFPYEIPKMIIFESVYSMNGHIAKIKEIAAIANEFNALTFIDEVHAVGVYGATGGGITEIFNLTDKIDIIQGTFSKGFGVGGGYVTANATIIDAIRSESSGFIFSSTMPIAVSAACLASVNYLKESQLEREIYFDNLNYIRRKFKENNINLISNNSHIMALHIGDSHKVQLISEHLLNQYKIYVQHINYPTVPKGGERLRITISPKHTRKMIDYFIESLKETFIKYDFYQSLFLSRETEELLTI